VLAMCTRGEAKDVATTTGAPLLATVAQPGV
jgi:hypothetical protein